jgi:hypothetical protein
VRQGQRETHIAELFWTTRDEVHFRSMVITKDLPTPPTMVLALEERELGVASATVPRALIGSPLTVALMEGPRAALEVFQDLDMPREDLVEVVTRVV